MIMLTLSSPGEYLLKARCATRVDAKKVAERWRLNPGLEKVRVQGASLLARVTHTALDGDLIIALHDDARIKGAIDLQRVNPPEPMPVFRTR